MTRAEYLAWEAWRTSPPSVERLGLLAKLLGAGLMERGPMVLSLLGHASSYRWRLEQHEARVARFRREQFNLFRLETGRS